MGNPAPNPSPRTTYPLGVANHTGSTPPQRLAGTLREEEKAWIGRFQFLKSCGYVLRPRYRPGWKPHWTASESLADYEDSFSSWHKHLLDAVRVTGGTIVVLKRVPITSPELEIGLLPKSDKMRHDVRNHGVPLLDILKGESDPEHAILVFPLLRRLDSPSLGFIRDAVDFVEQSLEGLVFLHEHKIAHRDCAWGNIMMDGRALYPHGWHPQDWNFYPDGKLIEPEHTNPSRTSVGGVRYYYIDFGISSFNEDKVLGLDGQERAPELSDTEPYDPYQLDVYILGMVYVNFILAKHFHVEFVRPLVAYMTPKDSQARPTAAEALKRFQELRAAMTESTLCQRISPSKELESPITRRLKDISYRFWDYWWTTHPTEPLPPMA